MSADGEAKAILLVRLLNAIDQGRHSFDGLKDKVGEATRRPSTRTLRRYLAILAGAGFPLYFDRAANVYRFSEGYSLKRLDLSDGELFGLVALRSLSASIGGSIGSSIDEVAEKLVGSAGRSARAQVNAATPVAFRLSEVALDKRGEQAFALLSAAERSTRSVRFKYRDKEGTPTARTVDPYGFIINAEKVSRVAFDHTRNDKRTFAVNSISEPLVLAKTFVRPGDFNVEAYAASSIQRGAAQRRKDRGARALCQARGEGGRCGAHRCGPRGSRAPPRLGRDNLSRRRRRRAGALGTRLGRAGRDRRAGIRAQAHCAARRRNLFEVR